MADATRAEIAARLAQALGRVDEPKARAIAALIVGWFCQADRARFRMREDGSFAHRRVNTPAEIARGGRLLIFWALGHVRVR